ncbi:MAG: Sua5/YciO/YrdC/YwlC family protein, partial [Flavobacteriaceae bacterium]
MAEYLKIYPENPQERLIEKAVQIIKQGGIVIFPSDTLYAIGCDLTQVKA